MPDLRLRNVLAKPALIQTLFGIRVGFATDISRAGIAVLFAFLAGGIVRNVLKEELPEERERRFSAFAAGAVLYTVLLLAA